MQQLNHYAASYGFQRKILSIAVEYLSNELWRGRTKKVSQLGTKLSPEFCFHLVELLNVNLLKLVRSTCSMLCKICVCTTNHNFVSLFIYEINYLFNYESNLYIWFVIWSIIRKHILGVGTNGVLSRRPKFFNYYYHFNQAWLGINSTPDYFKTFKFEKTKRTCFMVN